VKPQFPIYIVSKGRADSRMTVKALDELRVDYFVIIEEQEFDAYAAVIARDRLLVLPKRYQERYDTCDRLGDSKSKGPGPARNFAWEHSIKHQAAWHWVMDDNIRCFYRLNRNLKVRVSDGTCFRVMEDFCLRYRNVAMAGPNYLFFAKQKQKLPPFITNTRIYSCNLIRNDVDFRWRGRYNEDTDLSLRMLKRNWCTVQFNAFLQSKMRTQTVKGGNTEEFYAKEGTRAKSEMLVAMHPDVTRLTWKFQRIHHEINYRPFQRTQLVLKEGLTLPEGVDNYGMAIVRRAPAGVSAH
jgi:hypothetical protein